MKILEELARGTGFDRPYENPHIMTRGQRPKPVAVQIAEGDPRKLGTHKLEQKLASEPKATLGLERPKHLKGLALETWNFWSEEIAIMNLDNKPDAQMLEGACIAYARAVAADQVVDLEGILVPTRDGQRAHPAISVSLKAWMQVYRFATEFGLSPVSRTRLASQKRAEPSKDLASILSQPREERLDATVQ